MDDKNKPAWRERIQLKKRSKTLKKSAQKQARKVEGATMRHAHRFLVSRWDKVREIRLHIIVWLGSVAVLIALVGLQMVWFQRSYVTKAAVNGGTYAEAIKGSIDTLNPLYATQPAELAASHLLFSSLYQNDTTGHLRGDVAKTMNIEGDKVFTVKLRPDVRWHDGEPLTANDVVYTVGLMRSQVVRSVMAASWQGVAVSRIDDYTVQFTLPAAYAAFPQALTFSILPEHILKTVDQSIIRESSYSKAPIGSGPFKLRLLQSVNVNENRKVVHMDANRDYYAGSPRLDHLQIHTYGDNDSMGKALRTGEVNAASDIDSTTAEHVDGNRFTTVAVPVNSGVYALFNLAQPALKDQVVRRALLMGTDTTAIRKKLYGNPQALSLPFFASQVNGLSGIAAPVFDKSTAKQLLETSGWQMVTGVRTKAGAELRLRVVTRKNSDYEVALQSLAGQWRELGVKVDSVVVEPSTFTQDVLHDRNYDVLLDELVIGGDPDVFAYWHSRGLLNFTGYGSQVSDDALSSARTTSNPMLRSVKYMNFARQWTADVPAIGLYQSNFIYTHSKDTRSVESDETIVSPDDHYAGVRYWTAEQGNVHKTP